MVQINFAQKQVNAKIVYYGPGMSGKTTNLEVIHQRAPEKNRGDLTSISTDGDRTLFFDFMPLDLGTVAGMRTCFQIYTVPGQVYYNSTRKLVLQGVDGVVFVADSSASMVQENLESLRNLEENLNEYGKSLANLPLVIQYNKRDLPDALPVDELHQLLNKGNAPTFEGIANTGQGVFPTLKALAGLVLDQIHQSYGSQDGGSPAPENAGGGFGAPAPAAPMGSTGFYPAGQGAPSQPAPPPAAAVPSPAAQTQTGFHPQPQLVQNAVQNPGMAQQQQMQQPQHAPQQPLHQTGFQHLPGHGQAPQGQPQQQAPQPLQNPQQGYGQPQPNQFGVDPLAATGVHAPPQFQHGAPAGQQQMAGAPMPGQQDAGGLRMARPQEYQSPPTPHGGGQAPQMQGGGAATPGGMMQQVQAPGQFAQGQAGAPGEGPRLRPRSSGRPSPAEHGGGSKRSAVLTTVFVVAALAVGAVLGRLVLSLF